MLDDRTVLRPDLAGKSFLVWDQQSNRFGWESYLGQTRRATAVPEYAVPARRADLSGLPPAWPGVDTQDLFHDEDSMCAHCVPWAIKQTSDVQHLIDSGVTGIKQRQAPG